MTKLQAIREFADFLAEGHTIIARERYDDDNWRMDITGQTPRLILPKNLESKSEEDKAFREDFIARCPFAVSFSDVTLTILHEFGHWYTRNVMDMVVYSHMVGKCHNYLTVSYEILATQWAVCWLLCSANRRVADDFENKYFGKSQSLL